MISNYVAVQVASNSTIILSKDVVLIETLLRIHIAIELMRTELSFDLYLYHNLYGVRSTRYGTIVRGYICMNVRVHQKMRRRNDDVHCQKTTNQRSKSRYEDVHLVHISFSHEPWRN